MFKVRIRSFERGLLFKFGEFVELLKPGVHTLWSQLWNSVNSVVTVVDTLETNFKHPHLDVMLDNHGLRDELEVVDLVETERALVWRDGRLAYIIGPGRHAFWKTPHAISVEVFDSNVLRFEHPQMDAVLAPAGSSQWLASYEVAEHEHGLLFKDGEFIETLDKGRHVFWTRRGRIVVKTIDRREQVFDVAGQEIMTRDKVTLRVNLVVSYLVSDAIRAVTAVSDYSQALYREAQLALRTAVGVRTLDELLADKDKLGEEIRDTLAQRAADFGTNMCSVGLRDVILPGEMKTILNKVIEAEKAAQANLIKRREETAAARSQANTARLLAENPVLARMKELELLQEVLNGARVSFVLGQGDIAQQLRNLTGDDSS